MAKATTETTDEKVRVHIKFATGQTALLFPRSKKTALFANWEAAEAALDKYGKRLRHDAQGIMTGATTGKVRTMMI